MTTSSIGDTAPVRWACDILGVSHPTVHSLIRQGHIRATNPTGGRKTRVSKADVKALLDKGAGL